MKNLLKNLESFGGDVAFALRALQLVGKEAPGEFPLLMTGEWKGRINAEQKMITLKVTDTNISDAFDYYVMLKTRNPAYEIPLDYEHQTFSGDMAPAAAWFDLAVRDKKLWATNVKWVPRGKSMVESGEYRFVSPAFAFGYPDPVTGRKYSMVIMNAALTNNPFLKGELPPLLMASHAARDMDVQMYLLQSHTTQQEEHMEPLLLLLTTFFSLAATAKPDEVVAKVNWLTEQLTAAGIVAKEGTVLTAQAVIDNIKARFADAATFKANYALVAKAIGAVETDPVEKLTALIATAKDKTGFVAQADFLALQAKINEKEVDQRITFFMSREGEGKISPATKDSFRALALKDRQCFEDLMAKAAPWSGVPLQFIETSSGVAAKGSDTDIDVAIGKQLNVSADQRKKYAMAVN